MHRRTTRADRTVALELTIYALIDPETSEVYIGKYRTDRLSTAYRRHLALEYAESRDMCEDMQARGMLPEFYVLEEITATKVEAYGHQLAWIRYFTEHGYWRDQEDRTAYYAEHLNAKNQALYDAIAGRPLEEVCNHSTRRLFRVRSVIAPGSSQEDA